MAVPLTSASLLAVLQEIAAGRSATTTFHIAAAAGLDEVDLEAARDQLVDHGVLCGERGEWYAPNGVDLLDLGRLEGLLSAACSCSGRLDVRAVTGSTNDDARRLLEEAENDARPPVAVLAEAQDAGRGRRGRAWQSPVASNLYMTQIEVLPEGPESARGLSLATGVAVAEALKRAHGIDVALKWPNDLLVEGRKLGGILVELVMAHGCCHALLGIGVNVRVPRYVARTIDQPWIDLAALGIGPAVRNETAAAIIAAVRSMAAVFRVQGFDARMRARWQARDLLFGRAIVVSSDAGAISGVARGVDEGGELLVDTPTGRRSVSAGEVSIRPGGHDGVSEGATPARGERLLELDA